MSNDTGIVVRNIGKKWLVRSKNASNGHENTISEHDDRAEAIDRAAEEAQYPIEYGIMHIDPAPPNHLISREGERGVLPDGQTVV